MWEECAGRTWGEGLSAGAGKGEGGRVCHQDMGRGTVRCGEDVRVGGGRPGRGGPASGTNLTTTRPPPSCSCFVCAGAAYTCTSWSGGCNTPGRAAHGRELPRGEAGTLTLCSTCTTLRVPGLLPTSWPSSFSCPPPTPPLSWIGEGSRYGGHSTASSVSSAKTRASPYRSSDQAPKKSRGFRTPYATYL